MSKKKRRSKNNGDQKQWSLSGAMFDEVTQRRFKKQNPFDVEYYRAKTVHQALLGPGECLEKLSIYKLAQDKQNGLFDLLSKRGIFCCWPCATEHHSRSAYHYELDLSIEPVSNKPWEILFVNNINLTQYDPNVHGCFCDECGGVLNSWRDDHGETPMALIEQMIVNSINIDSDKVHYGVAVPHEINLTPIPGYFPKEDLQNE